MRLKESFALDAIIKERAKSLSRPEILENSRHLGRRAQVLKALIDCRDLIDDIMRTEMPAIRVGDINIQLPPGAASGSARSFQPFNGGDLAQEVKRELKRTL